MRPAGVNVWIGDASQGIGQDQPHAGVRRHVNQMGGLSLDDFSRGYVSLLHFHPCA